MWIRRNGHSALNIDTGYGLVLVKAEHAWIIALVHPDFDSSNVDDQRFFILMTEDDMDVAQGVFDEILIAIADGERLFEMPYADDDDDEPVTITYDKISLN